MKRLLTAIAMLLLGGCALGPDGSGLGLGRGALSGGGAEPAGQSCETNCDCPVNEYCQIAELVVGIAGGPQTGGAAAGPACPSCTGGSCPPCPAPAPAPVPQGICVAAPTPVPGPPPGPPVEIDGGLAPTDAGTPACGPAPMVMLPNDYTLVCSPNGHWVAGPSCASDADCVKSNPDECNICPAGEVGYACVEGACLCGCQ